MSSRNKKDTLADPPRLSGSPDWIGATARLLVALHTQQFPIALREMLDTACAFDSMIVTAYSGSSRPRSLYHDFDEVQAAINISFYELGPYLLDPFFLAGQEEIAPGAYRLIDLAPDAFFKSEYYRTFYRRIRMSDEMGLIVSRGAGRWIVVSVARWLRRPKFSATDVAVVNEMFPILSAAVLRHWGDDEPQQAETNRSLRERLKSFGNDQLSARESEVVQLILQGHSTPSAAALIGIAEGTVKVHRRHAYAKLGIVSQAELFSRAMRYLTEIGG
ncbi:MAG: helix-turn-helix transcriptional regulator [Hyphomicrobiales bacterium]|nr:helix-turn-helix transcriptional regulator [Hyphomicrobiales bacterium]